MIEERENFTTSPVDDDEPRVPSSRPMAAPIFLDDDEEDGGMTAEERAALYELYAPSLQSLGEGEIVRGTILAITDNEVLVDVGLKSEGVINLQEFTNRDEIKVGDEVEVFLEKMENQDGLVVLSKQRADFVRVWDRVKAAADAGELVEGKLVRKIKGGVVVDL